MKVLKVPHIICHLMPCIGRVCLINDIAWWMKFSRTLHPGEHNGG